MLTILNALVTLGGFIVNVVGVLGITAFVAFFGAFMVCSSVDNLRIKSNAVIDNIAPVVCLAALVWAIGVSSWLGLWPAALCSVGLIVVLALITLVIKVVMDIRHPPVYDPDWA
jgi:hypothetical protein